MQLNLNKINFVLGTPDILENMKNIVALKPFDDDVIDFLNTLSVKLIRHRAFPDVATFGFWCRKAALIKEKEKYDDLNERLGRGVVFHIAPSNVPVNFAFSFVSGLLAGNANIVRVSNKDFEQVKIISKEISVLLDNDFKDLAPYMCFIKYDHDSEITDYLSGICDTRVIWGGNQTINMIRRSPLKPRANEIDFSDRHSFLVIDADEYLNHENKDRLINDFYNDTYYSDQNACTAPRIIFWRGENKECAKKDFWERVHTLVKEKYELAPVQSVGKLSALYKAGAFYNIKKEESEDCLIYRMKINELDENLMNFKYNSGFFFEKDIVSLDEILPICTSPCQTMTYFGINKEEMRDFINDKRPRGIDRIVPVGSSMDFALTWDGYDLIRMMSRRVSVL